MSVGNTALYNRCPPVAFLFYLVFIETVTYMCKKKHTFQMTAIIRPTIYYMLVCACMSALIRTLARIYGGLGVAPMSA